MAGPAPTKFMNYKDRFARAVHFIARLSRDSRFAYGTHLNCNQLSELGRDICHRIFCGAQAASRAEKGTDFTERFIRRLMHNGNEPVTRQKRRKFFVGDALCWETA